ncbi:MAG: cache domain-containing protein, partial [Thermodesulfobacteriota bacterium]
MRNLRAGSLSKKGGKQSAIGGTVRRDAGAVPALVLAFLLLSGFTACAHRGTPEGSRAAAPPASRCAAPVETVVSLIAGNLETDLSHLSASIRSLGSEFADQYEKTPFIAPEEERQWLARAKTEKKTTGFLLQDEGKEPAYQADLPAYLVYRDGHFDPGVWRELKAFLALAPSFRLAFETFDYSWVYLATARETMMIYPYLPLSEATNNYPLTAQVFYTAADYANRTFGWTEPYLDLVGAGMMVTVSWPIFLDNELLGVASRDITLNQLAARTLAPVGGSKAGLTAFIVNRNGMVIANSDPAAMKEVNEANEQAKAAVLHYRTVAPPGSAAVLSSFDLYNRACEEVLTLARENRNDEFLHGIVQSGGAAHR